MKDDYKGFLIIVSVMIILTFGIVIWASTKLTIEPINNVSFDKVQQIPGTNTYCNNTIYDKKENMLYCNIEDIQEGK